MTTICVLFLEIWAQTNAPQSKGHQLYHTPAIYQGTQACDQNPLVSEKLAGLLLVALTRLIQGIACTTAKPFRKMLAGMSASSCRLLRTFRSIRSQAAPLMSPQCPLTTSCFRGPGEQKFWLLQPGKPQHVPRTLLSDCQVMQQTLAQCRLACGRCLQQKKLASFCKSMAS